MKWSNNYSACSELFSPKVPSSSVANLMFRAVGHFQFQCNFWQNAVLHLQFSSRYSLVIFPMINDFRIISDRLTVFGHVVMFIIVLGERGEN